MDISNKMYLLKVGRGELKPTVRDLLIRLTAANKKLLRAEKAQRKRQIRNQFTIRITI